MTEAEPPILHSPGESQGDIAQPLVQTGPQFAHGAGHFPTLEEISRLEKLEHHRSQGREAGARWRKSHPGYHTDAAKAIESSMRWARAHPEKGREYSKRYYQKKKQENAPKTLDEPSSQ